MMKSIDSSFVNNSTIAGDLENSIDTEQEAKDILKNRLSEEDFDDFKRVKYSDLLKSMDSLKFLKSDQEKVDLINFTVYQCVEVLRGKIQHLVYLDRSARIMGVYMQDVLSHLDDDKHSFSRDRIFFVNPNNIESKELTDEDRKLGETLAEGSSTMLPEYGYHVSNVIIDEYIASGKGSEAVERYLDKIINLYKKDKSRLIDNYIHGFYGSTSGKHHSTVRNNGDWPSWYDKKETSGVIEVNGEIKPGMNESALAVREDLKKSSEYTARLVHDLIIYLNEKKAKS